MTDEPSPSMPFSLIIDGVPVASFRDCSGPTAAVDPISFREAGSAIERGNLPGQIRYQPIVLSHGFSTSAELWNWMQQTESGDVVRRDVSVVMLGNDGMTGSFSWALYDAWVSQWRAAPLDAASSEVQLEALTIVYDRVERT